MLPFALRCWMRFVNGTGMQWSLATSDGLAALQTLVLNGGWDRY